MPRCADYLCGRWRPDRLAPKWLTGVRFNDQWYCSARCVEHAARLGLDAPATAPASAGSLPPMRLGALLRHFAAIPDADLTRALQSQQASGRRIGAELRHLGLVDGDTVLRALAAQAGVSYLTSFDVRRVMNGPAWLPSDTVRALGLVPFERDERQQRIQVICPGPVPRAALRALTKLTGWTAEPFLVDDEIWQQARDSYRPQEGGSRYAGATIAPGGIPAVAARIAASAQATRSVTMRHATYDQVTWIRVEDPRQVSDLLIAHEEQPCQAERIAR